jgi:hypothetical protein
MTIQLNKIYNFTIDNSKFGDLDDNELNSLFQDGRVASHFLEIQITKWFPELQRKEIKRGRAKSDHVDENNIIYEMKNFTKYGCKVMPSYQYGGSRNFNFDEFEKLAKETTYIICDIRKFPNIRIIFKNGNDMVKMFPKGLVDVKQENILYV